MIFAALAFTAATLVEINVVVRIGRTSGIGHLVVCVCNVMCCLFKTIKAEMKLIKKNYKISHYFGQNKPQVRTFV